MEFHPLITTFTIMESISNSHTSSSSSQSICDNNNNPLFSSIVTFYLLVLLYFPQFLVKVIFSPLLSSTFILLVSLLRLGASQQRRQTGIRVGSGGANVLVAPPLDLTRNDHESPQHPPSKDHGPKPDYNPNKVVIDVARPPCNTTEANSTVEPGLRPEPEDNSLENWLGKDYSGWAEPEPVYSPRHLIEWDVGAPLEVIYEAYEGEEEGEEDKNDEFNKKMEGVLDRYPSLSRYYPESSDSDSDSDSSSSIMSWDEVYEGREGLIEIALDYGLNDKKNPNNNVRMKVDDYEKEVFYFDDEDNMFEIDISHTKNSMGNLAR